MAEGSIAADELRLLIERIERLEEEKKAIADDIKDVYAEAKARGYDTKTIRECVKLRKMETNERQEREALLETYKAALGLDYAETPLGRAAVQTAVERAVEAVNNGALGPGVTATVIHGEGSANDEQTYRDAVTAVREADKASVSYLQRQFRLSYNAASRMIERMEREGVVSPPDSSGKRAVRAPEPA